MDAERRQVTKCLFDMWADEEIEQQLSEMGVKQNIAEKIAAKRNDKCENHERASIIQLCIKRI